ncbi:RNA-binding protein 28-like [Ornithodoros turicata]|uniref:RNA-binding protein 28-like n=1 Tax=Ornithodoros turicata TaxID=34597 RepID=UPI003139A81E
MAAPMNTAPCTLLVRNIPQDVTNNELQQVFGEIGPTKRCFIVRDKLNPKVFKGIGYVTFAVRDDAEAALKRTIKLHDNALSVKIAPHKFSRPVDKTIEEEKKPQRKLSKEEKKAKRKRKARLIVHNLSFKADEDILQETFGKYGRISEITIPKRPDGKMRGFAFVQFVQTKDAIKAINGLNATSIAGRPVAVDFSLPKSKFESIRSKSQEQGTKSDSEDDASDECDDQDDNDRGTKQDDSASDSEEEDEDDDDDIERGDSEDSERESEGDEESDDESDDENENRETNRFAKPRNLGSTVFVRNLPFTVQQEEFQKVMEAYGTCKYCLLCRDPATDHPKGTAFVCYTQDESAKKCIEAAGASEGIALEGRRLTVTRALSREELEEKTKADKKKEKKDRRNLYLAREGLVRPGTEGAHNVSAQDMAKRARLQARKKKLLQNLHYFVSQTRLSVHNLPPSVDDRKLRTLFLRHAPQGARLTEARVMRNLQTATAESKGFGFVTFTKHEDALAALREVNNNPDVFGPKRRPIVEFCLENRAVLVAKERRLQRSKQKAKEIQAEQAGQSAPDSGAVERKPFMGTLANRKMKGMPTHVGAKVRTKKGRKKSVVQKKGKGEGKGRQFKRQKGKNVQSAHKNPDAFGQTVEKHKRKLEAAGGSGGGGGKRWKKWFQK